MKELNIEEKAQRYDKAIEKLSSLHNNYDTVSTLIDIKEELEAIFPEIKESEDERMRKEMLQELKDSEDSIILSPLKRERWIAWLEKQCENFQYWKPSEEQLDALDYAYNSCPDTERGNYYEGVLETLIDDLHKLSEKQGKQILDNSEKTCKDEQKPTDKVEPKFKIGDWVVYHRNNSSTEIMSVYDIRDNRYYFNDNVHFSWPVKECDEKCHLWAIQDAKDGDVLSFNDGHGNDCIELIKSITNKKIEFWFCLTNGNSYEVFDGALPYTNLASRENATPATKEQREQLEKAMADAGYRWNPDEKKMEKIEQKPSIEMITPGESLGIDSDTYNKIVDECAYGEQKPVNMDYISGIRKELLNIEDNAENIVGLTESQWVAIRAAHRLLGEYITKEQKPSWTKVDNSRENVVFPFNARVKDSDKVVTITDGQLNLDGKQWRRFSSNRDDGFKVYCPEDLLVAQNA